MATQNNKVKPVRLGDFGMAEHRYICFDAMVPGDTTKKQIEDGSLWGLIAHKVDKMGDEIRVLADDMSFVAYAIVTYKRGTDVKLKILRFHELDEVKKVPHESDDYKVKFRGPRKWSIVKQSTGEIVQEDIDTEGSAIKQLEEYQAALSR